MVAAIAAAAFCAPAIALAADPATPSAESACRAERTAMGDATFKATYGTNKNKSNAFGKCVSKRAAGVKAAADSAAKACKAEQAADPAAFAQKYGTKKNKKNAYGKCVSAKAKAQVDAKTAATVAAAKACKTERTADAAAFKAKYGTNKNKSNAFGKCVSAKAKA
jgi:hypothetical protein